VKNKTLKIIFIVIFSIIIIFINKCVQANSINSISMDIYLDTYGNATVEEVWACTTNQGTEVYHPYYNLGNSQITNLMVLENGRNYTTLSSWDTSGSLSSKAYKCGINTLSNGVELCWGMSEYGSHMYTVRYKISNFVSELADSQMIYWTLIPNDFSNSIEKVEIKIHSDKYISDSVDVWGYGNYGGLAYVNNGAIYMASDGRLDTSEYMTILVKFPLNTFNCSNILDNEFNYYYNMAEDGAESYVEENDDGEIVGFFMAIGMFFIALICSIIAAIQGSFSSQELDFGTAGKKIHKNVEYYRDIPVNGDLFRAYYIGYQYGILRNKTDLLGSIILKWMKDGLVETKEVEVGKYRKKKETAIIFKQQIKEFENEKETNLYNMLYEASEDGVLEKKEFEKWCRGKYNKIFDWFDNILKEEKQKLLQDGLIIKETKTKVKLFKGEVYTATLELKDLAVELAGLKRYLKEYTLIKDREAMQVVLFENYLIYAQLMGIARQVTKEFKDLYPELIEQSHYSSYDDILFINYCSASGITAANNARSVAQSYSGGGGGFSSGGGGGGSFGGGFGRRRIPLKMNNIKGTKII